MFRLLNTFLIANVVLVSYKTRIITWLNDIIYIYYSRDQHGLVLPVLHHVGESVVSNGVQMGRHLGPPLAAVLLHDRHLVDGQALVGVDGDTEQARVGL